MVHQFTWEHWFTWCTGALVHLWALVHMVHRCTGSPGGTGSHGSPGALGDDLEKITFYQAKMHSHSLECFEKKLSPFPNEKNSQQGEVFTVPALWLKLTATWCSATTAISRR